MESQENSATDRAVGEINWDRAGVWLDAMAHETVERLREYAGMSIDWCDLVNAMQREVIRQIPSAEYPIETVTIDRADCEKAIATIETYADEHDADPDNEGEMTDEVMDAIDLAQRLRAAFGAGPDASETGGQQ